MCAQLFVCWFSSFIALSHYDPSFVFIRQVIQCVHWIYTSACAITKIFLHTYTIPMRYRAEANGNRYQRCWKSVNGYRDTIIPTSQCITKWIQLSVCCCILHEAEVLQISGERRGYLCRWILFWLKHFVVFHSVSSYSSRLFVAPPTNRPGKLNTHAFMFDQEKNQHKTI